jgi:hypothetical protein
VTLDLIMEAVGRLVDYEEKVSRYP